MDDQSKPGAFPTDAEMARTVVIKDFSPRVRASLRGFCSKVLLPSGMVLHDVAIYQDGQAAWASPPSKPMLDRNGVAMKDADGKIRYAPVVSFASRQACDEFSHAVIAALRTAHPDALL